MIRETPVYRLLFSVHILLLFIKKILISIFKKRSNDYNRNNEKSFYIKQWRRKLRQHEYFHPTEYQTKTPFKTTDYRSSAPSHCTPFPSLQSIPSFQYFPLILLLFFNWIRIRKTGSAISRRIIESIWLDYQYIKMINTTSYFENHNNFLQIQFFKGYSHAT